MTEPGTAPYVAHYVPRPIALSGQLDDPAWQVAPRTAPFVDMETGGPALLHTTAAVLWDDANLYAGFWVEDPYPRAELTARDSIIFTENDVEVFVDGGDCYYELELNALGTVYEVLFVWRDALVLGSRFYTRAFDPLTRDALTFGGDYDRQPASFWRGTHPRGTRWAFLDWDCEGLQVATHVDGRLNDPTTRSQGWTAEVAMPWSGLEVLANGRAIPPRDGDQWRLFLGRFQWLEAGSQRLQAAWCATPHGVYDTHMPERFTPVRFARSPVTEG